MRLRKVSVSAGISYFEESFRGAASQGIDPQIIRQPKRDNAVESITGYPPRRNGKTPNTKI